MDRMRHSGHRMISRALCRSVNQPVSRHLLHLSIISQAPEPYLDLSFVEAACANARTISHQQNPVEPAAGTSSVTNNDTLPVIAARQVSGVVKWYDPVKAFGFIKRDDNYEDVYVHYTDIETKNPLHAFPSLDEGEIVVFDVVVGCRSLKAVRVTGPGGAPVRGSQFAQKPMGGTARGSFSFRSDKGFTRGRVAAPTGYGALGGSASPLKRSAYSFGYGHGGSGYPSGREGGGYGR